MPRTPAAERAAPRTDQVGTLATLTTAGLLATVGAALVADHRQCPCPLLRSQA